MYDYCVCICYSMPPKSNKITTQKLKSRIKCVQKFRDKYFNKTVKKTRKPRTPKEPKEPKAKKTPKEPKEPKAKKTPKKPNTKKTKKTNETE